jgi:hypothetical protein
MSVTYKDLRLKDILAKIAAVGKLALTLGFQGDKAAQLYPEGVNVATVALYNEFGTVNAPARGFLRAAMFEFRDKIERLFAVALARMVNTPSMSPMKALESVGRSIVQLIERKIRDSRSWAKANAPSTVAGKGFDYPLHDSFLMSRSVTWAIRDRSGNILAIGGSHG